jgi:hypothetical protein
VPTVVPQPSAQLLLYRFGPDAEFEGRLVGALERIETGGALRILDVLFVSRNAATDELEAVSLRGEGAGGVVSPLLGFRLDAADRRRATQRTLDSPIAGEMVRELGKELPPGVAVAAVLVEHRWAQALDEAVARTGGTPLVNTFADATALAELAPDLLAAVGAADQ